MSINRYVLIAFIIFLPLVVLAGDSPIDEFSEKLRPLVEESIHDLKTYKSNGFSIQTFKFSPIDPIKLKKENHIYSMAIIKGDQTPSIHIGLDTENKNSFGFTVYHSKTNEPIISTGDLDGDGKLDGLTYYVMDKNGKALMEIIDYGMDGSDIRHHFDPKYSEIQYQNKWYKIEKKGDERGIYGIYINGEFKPLKNDGHRPYIE